MAVAVGISAVNAFTLSPALCALLLRPYTNEDGTVKDNFAARFRKTFNTIFDVLLKRYINRILFFIRRKTVAWGVLLASMVLLVILMTSTQKGLISEEDSCSASISMTSRPGTSMAQNLKLMKKIGKDLEEIDEIEYRADVAGFSFDGAGPSMGMSFLSLRPWDDRKGKGQSMNEVIDRINALGEKNPDLTVMAMASPLLLGFGMGSGFELMLQDKLSGDIQKFKEVADQFVKNLSARPEIGTVYSAFETNYPQYWVDVDAAKCEQSGISPTDVLETLSGYFTSGYISDFNRFSKRYSVMMQAHSSYTVTPESLNHLFVRAGQEMAPLSTFVKLTKTYGPSDLSRFNLFNAISIGGTAAEGYSSGEALKAIQETAAKTLPPNYRFEFGGTSREEISTSNNSVLIFGICLLLVYLLLCALYESLVIPFSIILSVPCGLMGSFLFAQLFKFENNIYLQTGLIMLIGLLAKTAILITEYAETRRKSGMTLAQSAVGAAKARLRPILMTALTMVFGMFPLMFSTEVGANGNATLGTGAVGGMVIGTLILLFLVPTLWMSFQAIQERIKPLKEKKRKMKIKAFITISCIVIVTLLSSCGIYNKYHRQTQVNEAIYRDEYRSIDTTSIASLPWKELFQDKHLQLLIDLALVHNTNLRTARLRTEAAKAVLQTARLAYLPSVELNPQGTITRWDNTTAKSYNLSVSATWKLDIFGKATNAKRGAKEALKESQLYEQAVQTQLIATVASNYYTLLMLDEQLRINRETLENWRQDSTYIGTVETSRTSE